MSPIYRRLLLCYPRDYRARHGAELLATLEETGRGFSVREGAALAAGGLRARLATRAGGSPWIDGLHLGLVLVTLGSLRMVLYPLSLGHAIGYLSGAAMAVFIVAMLRARPRLALLSGFAAGSSQLVLFVQTDGPFDSRLIPAYAAWWTAQLGFAAFLVSARRRGFRPRPWPWSLTALLVAQMTPVLAGQFLPFVGGWGLAHWVPSLLFFGMLLWAGVLTRSALWPFAAAVDLAVDATMSLLLSHGRGFVLVGQAEIPYLPLVVAAFAVATAVTVGCHRSPEAIR
ncbi:hypothetical protein GCM10022221_59330 [Actinocorallia aurea]